MDAVNYGPLTQLIGTWEGDKGMDVAPEPDGTEKSPYYETIAYEAAGDVDNAETETLSVIYYRRTVTRKSNDEVFHDQTGYWTWDPVTGTVALSLTIPRAVCVLAGGTYAGEKNDKGATKLSVAATLGDKDWSVIQSPFMRDNASTESYSIELEVSDDKLRYKEITMLDIYGRAFEHTDRNILTKV